MVLFCPKCGTKAPDDESAFCNKCGTRFPPVIPEKMEIFCPKCGTKAPDDESAFCNKCGTRLPPAVPEKTGLVCQRCGTKIPDTQAVFCNKCGSPVYTAPPLPVRQAAARPPAVPPVIRSCPSCGSALVDEISDYCNVCGANVHAPSPPAPVTTPPVRSPEKTAPVTPVMDLPDGGGDVPVPERNRRPFLKWGLIAIAVILVLAAAVAFVPGMISGINQSAAAPAPASGDTHPVTTIPTRITTQTTAPVTTTPAKVKTTTVPKTTAKKNASTTPATNASKTVTTNATRTVTTTVPVTNLSRTLSIGESASDGKGKLTVDSVTFRDKMGDPTPSYAIGKKYLIVGITYENLQKNETTEVNLNGMLVKDGGGYTFDKASDVTLEKPFDFIGKTVPPLEKRTGNMLYIVPPEATLLKFQYDFGNQNIATFQLT